MMKFVVVSVVFSLLFSLSIASIEAQDKKASTESLPSSVQRDRVDTLELPMRITPGDTSFEYHMPAWPNFGYDDTTFVSPKQEQDPGEKQKPERKHQENDPGFIPLEDQPRIIKKVDPVYPPEAKKVGLEDKSG